ncbi:MAG: hypothetical protein WCJ26_13505 [bacterium]
MKNIVRLTSMIFLFGLTLTGCYYDKENELYPLVACGDTANVTYGKSIAPIMAANCNICHNASNPSGNVITNTPEGLNVVALDGNLWYGVTWAGPQKTHMPQGALDTLSICDRTKIKKWIDAGALNN